ncbi:M48 family metalloprotease [Bartonella bacilliformis]|uniref:M48 family metalloprotease n=1 Tax=Bartonella bacilliformis TaxID=774 RepID=UPI003CC96042
MIISFMLFLPACYSNFHVNNLFDFSESSSRKTTNEEDTYATLAAAHHPRILQAHGGAYRNPKLERMLANIISKLAAVSHDPNQTYRMTILDSTSINAFALPGGYIYVTRGMLTLANDSSEVAAVLAHEIAHITANHGILRFQKEAELRRADRLPRHILPSANTKPHDTLNDQQKLAQFSRNQELQADSIGIEMLAQAGYDPFASPRFLKSMEAYNAFRNLSGNTQSSLDFLATHPTTPKRINLAIEKARTFKTAKIASTDRSAFLKSIDGIIFGGSLHEGYVRGQNFIHPQLRITFSVPDTFTIETRTNTVVASGPNKIAFRFDAVSLTENISASDYLKSGWMTGLDESSVHPITIHGLKAAHAYASNENWQFDVVVIPMNNQVFRLITAAPHQSSNFHSIAHNITHSFRSLSWEDLQKLKPLKIRVTRVKQGDSIASLSYQMQETPHQEELFRIINGLSSEEILHVGSFVKIIAE